MDTYKNFAKATVATGFAAGATSISLTTGHGARLPAGPANFVVWNSTDFSDPSDDTAVEVFRGTVSGDTITVSARAQEGTSDVAHNTGGKTYKIIAPLTAKVFNTELSASASPTFVGLTLTGLTAGRVPYVGASDEIADSGSLLWDNSLGRLTLGTTFSPAPEYSRLVISDTAAITVATTFREILKVAFNSKGSAGVTTGTAAASFWASDASDVVNKTITNAVSNGGPDLIRITATGHGFSTGDLINVYGVGGTTEANAAWNITVIDANTFDLIGSTHTNAYTSGGTATNRGQLVPARHIVVPLVDRDFASAIGDDANGLTVGNASDKKATDGIWITDERSTDASAWRTVISSDSASDYFLRYTGKIDIAGIDVSSATLRDANEPMILLGAGHNIQLDTATGTKIGTATSQKLGFFNATPIVQNTSTTDLRAGLINLGLFATGGASPLNLNGGTLTALKGVISTGTITTSQPGVAITQTWNDSGVTFTGLSSSITATAAAALSKFFDFQEGGESRLYLNHSGVITQTAKNGQSTNYTFTSNSGTVNGTDVAVNTALPTFLADASGGTFAQPLRVKSGQILFRVSTFGWGAASDTGSATRSAAHRAAMDLLTSEAWTTTAHGTYLRFRATATGGTTTNAKAFIGPLGLELNAAATAPTSRGTTDPTNALNLIDGTAPAGTLTNGVSLYSGSGKLKSADAAGLIGHVVSASAVSSITPTLPNRTLTVEVNGTTYYIHAKTTND